ncbi:hypothetical protein FH972_022331 [Carpinus fangiana]|uniref:tRNA(Phe) (4-demethylwyosine(37)-C(7)) aminocarboxypropyltransferase n=1 Tax=Carpinus fangiana TaxID=176857 RepID=A0A5N6KU67_9ROSI|nr:hypothetical protein FH972_022331 [Carpinus fangiana]
MQNAFRSAVQQSLCKISETHLDSIETAAEKLLATLPAAYSIYHPLLLIPSTILERAAWNRLLLGYVIPDQSNNLAHFDLGPFFVQVAEATSTTHVAINSPIPTHNEPHAPDTDSSQVPFNAAADITSTNILRSPTNLIPLHGDFGPPLPSFPNHIPSENDFEKAFWVSTTQNGIKQTWAPRYTMFSKGNVTEKARLLTLPSVQNLQHKPWTALDLFSGIGYFAFSYARAGAARVLCWDLNPWSTEGLRRGAVRNGWELTCQVSCLLRVERSSDAED